MLGKPNFVFSCVFCRATKQRRRTRLANLRVREVQGPYFTAVRGSENNLFALCYAALFSVLLTFFVRSTAVKRWQFYSTRHPTHFHIYIFLVTTYTLSRFQGHGNKLSIHDLRNVGEDISLLLFLFLELLLLSFLSPLCTEFTIIHLKETMFLGYTLLQLFCIDSLCYT